MSLKTISNATSVHALFQYAMEWMDSFCGFLTPKCSASFLVHNLASFLEK